MNKNLTKAIIAAGLLSLAAPNAEAGLRQWMHDAKQAIVRPFVREAKPVCGEAAVSPCTPVAPVEKQVVRKVKEAPARQVIRERRDPSLDRIVDYGMGTIGGFCTPGDQVKLVLPDLTDAQARAGYTLRYEMAGRPKFSWLVDNGAIDGVEIRSGALSANDRKYVQYFKTIDTDTSGSYNTYTLKLPKENFALVLRDRNGKRVDARNIGATITARDCNYVTEVSAEATATGSSSAARAEATVRTPSETVTVVAEATAGDDVPADVVREERTLWRRHREKPLRNAGNREFNLGLGSFEHNFQTGYWVTRNNKEVFIPEEETYSGSQLMAQFKFTDDNTLFSIQAASSRGDNGTGNRYHNTLENTITAFSPSFNYEQTFGHARARIGLGLDGSYSSVTFGEGLGMRGPSDDNTVMRYRSVDGYANLIGMIGYQDGSHLKIKAGYGAQRMNFGRPNNSTTNDRRSDGVTERMFKGEASFQLYTVDDHVRIFGTGRVMAPQTQRATNWKEILDDSYVFNGEAGVEWIFNPESKNPFGVSGRVKFGEEDSTFIDGTPFKSSDIGLGVFGNYRF